MTLLGERGRSMRVLGIQAVGFQRLRDWGFRILEFSKLLANRLFGLKL